jgi:EAL domain-containing protein (putative c-di-GMP-specific phosphodiesterase class I)
LTVEAHRLLGLAFASADLLFEVDGAGAIVFAAGAGRRLAGRESADLIGAPWLELVDAADRPLAVALIKGVEAARRRGPAQVRLAASSRLANLSAFRLPENEGLISCALTLVDAPERPRRRDGRLCDRADFENAAKSLIEDAQAGGAELELGLIELGGLLAEQAKLGAVAAEALQRQVEGALRAEAAGDVATDLGQARYALLRHRGEAPEALAQRLGRVLGAALEPHARAFAIDPFADPGRMMRALRFSLDSFATDGAGPKAGNLSEVLDQSLQQTMAKAGAFGAAVQARKFTLLFQPVVALADLSVHHHEVLVRFDGEKSPADIIRMAEQLDIIESLDRAVAEQAVERLRADKAGRLRLAVNVSGRTIVSGGYVDLITRLASDGRLGDRLLFEVTESAAIDDLGIAQRHVQALQKLGFCVCLDDFGSGAASFGYLQQLSVDVVKIDGAYVRELASSGRDDAMIRHMVNLCRELKVATVAEMVETQPVADALRRAGVDYAQGWLYGAPAREPASVTSLAPKPAAKRRGEVTQWG